MIFCSEKTISEKKLKEMNLYKSYEIEESRKFWQKIKENDEWISIYLLNNFSTDYKAFFNGAIEYVSLPILSPPFSEISTTRYSR